jgi:hypothetical protein
MRQRATAAFFAISLRSAEVSFCALAFPPFNPAGGAMVILGDSSTARAHPWASAQWPAALGETLLGSDRAVLARDSWTCSASTFSLRQSMGQVKMGEIQIEPLPGSGSISF